MVQGKGENLIYGRQGELFVKEGTVLRDLFWQTPQWGCGLSREKAAKAARGGEEQKGRFPLPSTHGQRVPKPSPRRGHITVSRSTPALHVGAAGKHLHTLLRSSLSRIWQHKRGVCPCRKERYTQCPHGPAILCPLSPGVHLSSGSQGYAVVTIRMGSNFYNVSGGKALDQRWGLKREK